MEKINLLSKDQEILKLCKNGDIFVKGKFAVNDKEVVDALREFLSGVSNYPSELEPVLAKIENINSLGKSTWYEVVYFDKHWRCYAGSNTFKDGEKVVKWKYCKDCC